MTLDMNELFETVIGAAPATDASLEPVTKFILGSLEDRVVEVKDGMIQLYSLTKPFQTSASHLTDGPTLWLIFTNWTMMPKRSIRSQEMLIRFCILETAIMCQLNLLILALIFEPITYHMG